MSSEPGRKPKGPLRRGWTTGACATAAATAAFRALASGSFPDPVTIVLPKGERPSFPLSRARLEGGRAVAGVVKDAGDDPDVTDGAEVVAAVAWGPPGSGVAFRAGAGVGTVTRPGLPLPVGEPAINPAPRKMMAEAVAAIAQELGVAGDVAITVSVPGGERMAEKTLNGRLGIVGGLSILGTTGVVIPYSCSAWVSGIRSGIDVARALGLAHLAGATGKTSEAAVQRLYGLPDQALIDMGDFVGAMLKHLRRNPVPRLTIAGGFGKLGKLAQGALDLHSARSRPDRAAMAGWLKAAGAGDELVARALDANTSHQVLDEARAAGIALGDIVAGWAREVALAGLSGGTAVDVLVFDRDGALAGRAGP
jgi:cobalt-precorrin-5B (C1)-methyltransferase